MGGGMGGGMMGGGGAGGASGGGQTQQSEPEKWSYNVTIITQLDESPAEPNPIYNKAGITPHDYDSVLERTDRPIAAIDPRKPNF